MKKIESTKQFENPIADTYKPCPIDLMYGHITDPENRKSIKQNGLRAGEDGYIYLFNDRRLINTKTRKSMKVSDDIAVNQVFLLEEYLVILIDPAGIKAEIELDEVAELSRGFLWRVQQPVIEPQYLRLFRIRKTNKTAPNKFRMAMLLAALPEQDKGRFLEDLKQLQELDHL